MRPDYLDSWLIAFVCTQLIEVPIYRRMLGVGRFRAFAASAITHPCIWFVIFPASIAPYWSSVSLAELFAVTVEGLWFARVVGWRRAFVSALVANGASFLFGMVSQAVLRAF